MNNISISIGHPVIMAVGDFGFFALDAKGVLHYCTVLENIFYVVIVMGLPIAANRKVKQTGYCEKHAKYGKS